MGSDDCRNSSDRYSPSPRIMAVTIWVSRYQWSKWEDIWIKYILLESNKHITYLKKYEHIQIHIIWTKIPSPQIFESEVLGHGSTKQTHVAVSVTEPGTSGGIRCCISPNQALRVTTNRKRVLYRLSEKWLTGVTHWTPFPRSLSCRIWGSHRGGYEQSLYLLGYTESQPTFMRNMSWAWIWRRYVPPKSRLTANWLHCVISQKTEISFFTLRSDYSSQHYLLAPSINIPHISDSTSNWIQQLSFRFVTM
jgi:hypothetical protein